MSIGNIVIMVLGFIYLVFILIFYIFNPFKWKFIKQSKTNKPPCPICHGEGATTDHHDPCTECGGSGKVVEEG